MATDIRLRAWLCAGLAAATLLSAAPSRSESWDRVSLCELARDPAAFDQHHIELRAVFLSDLRHGHTLKDKQCDAPYLTMRYSRPEHASVQRFEKDLRTDIFDTSLRVYAVTLRGTFSAPRPDERGPVGAQPPAGTIAVDEVAFAKRFAGDWCDAPPPPD